MIAKENLAHRSKGTGPVHGKVVRSLESRGPSAKSISSVKVGHDGLEFMSRIDAISCRTEKVGAGHGKLGNREKGFE